MSQAPPPQPPVPAGAGGPGSFSAGDAISYGWNAYWKNVGPMILIVLVIWAVQLVISLIAFPFDSLVVRFILQAIGWIVGLLLAMGLIRASLAVTAGEAPDVAMLFKTEGLGPYLVASVLFGIMLSIGLLLCVIPGIIVACIFGFYGFVIVQEGDSASPLDSLKRSAEITAGRRWQIFGLGILLFLINVVGALLCGIGLLFTAGITAIAWAYAFRTLAGQAIAPAQ